MKQIQEQRHIYYDHDLSIEAYHLSGIVQKFPNHFHDYYVIGFVEGGQRHLWCKGQEYDLTSGDLLLFNPHDNHSCAPVNGEILDYRAINIPEAQMSKAVYEITDKNYVPYFTQNVVYQSEIAQSVSSLYQAILIQGPSMEKEELFFFLLEQILQEYTVPLHAMNTAEPSGPIKSICTYLEQHFAENITLHQLLSFTDFGKSYLLRTFTKQTGLSPYRYLQTIRLKKAREFLEQGNSPIDVANRTGFTDQSHFTRFFKDFTGLTPKQYQNIFFTNQHPISTKEEQSHA